MQLSETQAMLGIIATVLSFVFAAWKVGKAMGEFSTAQNGLANEVKKGFLHVNNTLDRHSRSIQDLGAKQQDYEVIQAVIKQRIGWEDHH
jgi:hypothetical protein